MKERPIHVVHVIKGLARGGAETLLVEGLRVADREAFEFSYVHFLPGHDEVAAMLQVQGAGVVSFGTGASASLLAQAVPLARHLRRVRADIIHAHLPLAAVVARMAGVLAGVPVVYTEHNIVELYHPLTKLASRLTWGMQRVVVAVTPDVAESVRRTMGQRVPIRTILNGIDTERFSGTAADAQRRLELQIPPDAPVVGTVARFRAAKRLDVWLDTAARIHAEHPAVHFLMVGGGELYEAITRQAADMGLSDVVHFAGLQDDVQRFLAEMDVFLMSSEYEGFGLAPVEAMAMGVAVVATEVSGVRNVIEDGVTGLLVPFDSRVAEGLAQAVGNVLSDVEAAIALRAAGRTAAVNQYGIERMQRELESLYVEVMEAGGGKTRLGAAG